MYDIILDDEIDSSQRSGSLLKTPPPFAAASRHQHPGVHYPYFVWLNFSTERERRWMRIPCRKLSASGLAFLSNRLFYADQHVIIAHDFVESCPQLVLTRVYFCRVVGNGILEVCIRFIVNHNDPDGLRQIPTAWLALVLHNDWRARQKLPLSAELPLPA